MERGGGRSRLRPVRKRLQDRLGDALQRGRLLSGVITAVVELLSWPSCYVLSAPLGFGPLGASFVYLPE